MRLILEIAKGVKHERLEQPLCHSCPACVANRRREYVGGKHDAQPCSKVAVTRFTDTPANKVKKYGISVFAITVGPTHTEMMYYMIKSEAGKKWLPDLGNLLGNIMEGCWQPVEMAGTLVVSLASGKADTLTGKWITPEDNIDDILRRIEEIQSNELYAWSFHSLK